MQLFQSEIQDPENYAIFYLDVFAESLVDRKPWLNVDPGWTDPISVFKVDRTANACYLCLNIAKHVKTDRGSFHDEPFQTFSNRCTNSVALLVLIFLNVLILFNSVLTKFWPFNVGWRLSQVFFSFAVLKCLFTAGWKTSFEQQHSFYSEFFHSIWKWQHISQCLSLYWKMAYFFFTRLEAKRLTFFSL